MGKISNLDLNWPEVTLATIIIFVIVAWLQPDVLWLVVEALKALAEPLGNVAAKFNPLSG